MKAYKRRITVRAQCILSQIPQLIPFTTTSQLEIIIKRIFTTWHNIAKILSARTKLTKWSMDKWLGPFHIMKQILLPLQPITNWSMATIADRVQEWELPASGTKKAKRTTILFLAKQSQQILRTTWKSLASQLLRIGLISSLEHSVMT